MKFIIVCVDVSITRANSIYRLNGFRFKGKEKEFELLLSQIIILVFSAKEEEIEKEKKT